MTDRDIKSTFIQLGETLAADRDAAFSLWTWLPSHKIAEKHHGDYADTVCPTVNDVLVEAAMFLAYLKDEKRAWTPSEEEWFERCPCGEDHLE